MGIAFQPGESLRGERYEIEEVLRSPSLKTVYRARDRVLSCEVALDIFSNKSIMPSGLTVSAWEARVLGKLGDHPNIATVLDYWEDDTMAGMATRYLTGGSLHDLIQQQSRKVSGNSLPIEELFRLSIEIAYGLAHIHERRILYRDLQPRNVLFDEWGTIHLVDFDTAVSLDDRNVSDLSYCPVINYMAPELTEGSAGDERADLYSLGATMYEMAAGRPPFIGTRDDVLAARRAGPAPSLTRKDLPDALRRLTFRLLSPEPDRRPTRADEVAGRLEQLRATSAQIDRLLASNVDSTVLKTLETFLNTEGGAQFQSAFTPDIDLPPDYRLLMQAIMSLAETDYRRAAIDAGTASEVALASAISDELHIKELNSEYIDHAIRSANGIDGLYSLYLSFGHTLPVSLGNLRSNLAGVRNDAAHAGRIPSIEEATRAVEIAHELVTTSHPLSLDQ